MFSLGVGGEYHYTFFYYVLCWRGKYFEKILRRLIFKYFGKVGGFLCDRHLLIPVFYKVFSLEVPLIAPGIAGAALYCIDSIFRLKESL